MARYLSWDRYRGLAILLMAIVNFLATAQGIPAFLKHSPDVGYTLADLVAPMFIFAMGLTFGPSFLKRCARNKADAYLSVIKRNLAFIGLGAVFSGVGVYFAPDADWGVLQALGVAGLMTMCVIRVPIFWRALVALVILAGYQGALSFGAEPLVLAHLHGGMLGALSWGAMLMLTTVLVELYAKGVRPFGSAILLLAASGAALSSIAPVSKHLVSASYVLISLALCGALFWLCDVVERRFHLQARRDFLCDCGENPLALYLAHYALIGAFRIPGLWFVPPVWLSLVLTLVLALALTGIAHQMHRRGIRISL